MDNNVDIFEKYEREKILRPNNVQFTTT